MDRRRFLLVLAAGLAGASVAQGASGLGERRPRRPIPRRPRAGRRAGPGGRPVGRRRPPTGVVDALPGTGNSLALTIDDGTSSEVVAAFAALAVDTGIRLTFFPNGCYRSWEDNAAVLRPLVESGQVALGNHTWSHPDLTGLGDREVAEEISRNRDFLRTTFGVTDSPFFRPPFGARDERTDRIAADVGPPHHRDVERHPRGLPRARPGRAPGVGPEVVRGAGDRRRPRQPPDRHHRVRRAAGPDRRAASCTR